MRADIPQHVAGPGLARVDAPLGGLVLRLHRCAVKTMGKLHVHHADLAQCLRRDHRPGLFDQLVPGIAVGQAHDASLGVRQAA
ncbi:hypothetical protein D3C76_1326030 [compost metagenome]